MVATTNTYKMGKLQKAVTISGVWGGGGALGTHPHTRTCSATRTATRTRTHARAHTHARSDSKFATLLLCLVGRQGGGRGRGEEWTSGGWVGGWGGALQVTSDGRVDVRWGEGRALRVTGEWTSGVCVCVGGGE